MRNCSRREAVWFLLSGVGLLGGCVSPSGYKPTLPESCVWTKFPYTWICIDPKEGEVVPEKETASWDPFPLGSSIGVFSFEHPLKWEELVQFKSCIPLGDSDRKAP